MSRWLLVELADDLDHLGGTPPRTTRPSVFRGLVQVPGVLRVTDLEAISRATLDEWLLPADQTWEYQHKRGGTSFNKIRNYHKNKRQPGLW